MALPINSLCKFCRAPLIWLRSARGKPIPVEADSVRVIPMDHRFVAGLHRAHFCLHGHGQSRVRRPATSKRYTQGRLV